ncbi:Aste57867_21310 [Aphanomyces stellatus]|uniref:Aste57867_21310 protein n=1 Tax=Aphanomyces stellatus TaxID=120398 RepID=A0A485LH84_9STRA|nr:hypothetical protein As57867_021241 [Aphanomyces stellatus]VFT97982.1 Aste57867_21310 [Aphanomyces stellatus]
MASTTARRYPTVNLTADASFRLQAKMEGMLEGELQANMTKASVHRGYHVVSDTNGWSIFHREMPSSTSHEYVAFGMLKTSLVSIVDALFAKDSFEFRSVAALVYQSHLVDATLLDIVHDRTDANRKQFFGVKYLRLNAPTIDTKESHKEFLYVEMSGMCQDADGRPVLYVVTTPLTNTRVHTNVGSVKLYRARAPLVVDVISRATLHMAHTSSGGESHGSMHVAVTHAQSQGHLMYWKAMNVFIPRALAKDFVPLSHEAALPEMRRLATGPFAQAWGHSARCVTCQKKFHLLRAKHHCRHCGWSMCGACKVLLPCVDRSNEGTVSEEKFCKACVVQAKLDVSHEPPASETHRDLDAFEAISLYSPERKTEENFAFEFHPRLTDESNLGCHDNQTELDIDDLMAMRHRRSAHHAATHRPRLMSSSSATHGKKPAVDSVHSMILLYDAPPSPPTKASCKTDASNNQMELLADYDAASLLGGVSKATNDDEQQTTPVVRSSSIVLDLALQRY